jgi:hypothetical protein
MTGFEPPSPLGSKSLGLHHGFGSELWVTIDSGERRTRNPQYGWGPTYWRQDQSTRACWGRRTWTHVKDQGQSPSSSCWSHSLIVESKLLSRLGLESLDPCHDLGSKQPGNYWSHPLMVGSEPRGSSVAQSPLTWPQGSRLPLVMWQRYIVVMSTGGDERY